MRKIPIEAVEEVERELPEMVDAIQSRSKAPVVLLLDDFDGNADLFFRAVWYATANGRPVVIESDH